MLNDQYIGLALAMIGGFLAGVALLLILMPRRHMWPGSGKVTVDAWPTKPIPYASAIGSRPEAPWVTREEFLDDRNSTTDCLIHDQCRIDELEARLAAIEAATRHLEPK